jgi:hypothetical protein
VTVPVLNLRVSTLDSRLAGAGSSGDLSTSLLELIGTWLTGIASFDCPCGLPLAALRLVTAVVDGVLLGVTDTDATGDRSTRDSDGITLPQAGCWVTT